MLFVFDFMDNQPSPSSNRLSQLQFSQASLQDYVDCRRRFQLRYLLKVAWPALEAEPVLENERAMQQGALFHRLVQQHLLGIPAERLTPLAKGDDLSRWWQNFLQFDNLSGLLNLTGLARYPEITLAAPLDSYRLVAKYDLILISPDGRATIYDWKTSAKRPKREWLLPRLQTRVYPYLLSLAGGFLRSPLPESGDGGETERRSGVRGFPPSQIEMIYWFAESPTDPERIVYSADQYQRDDQYLKSLAAEIASLGGDDFHLTSDEKRCRFCTYRSLCNRGVKAGNVSDAEDSEPEIEAVDFDFDQIAEIAF